MAAEREVGEMANEFGRLMASVRDHVQDADPRSFDNCMLRLEEALMWANKGILTKHQGRRNGGSNEQRE